MPGIRQCMNGKDFVAY